MSKIFFPNGTSMWYILNRACKMIKYSKIEVEITRVLYIITIRGITVIFKKCKWWRLWRTINCKYVKLSTSYPCVAAKGLHKEGRLSKFITTPPRGAWPLVLYICSIFANSHSFNCWMLLHSICNGRPLSGLLHN